MREMSLPIRRRQIFSCKHGNTFTGEWHRHNNIRQSTWKLKSVFCFRLTVLFVRISHRLTSTPSRKSWLLLWSGGWRNITPTATRCYFYSSAAIRIYYGCCIDASFRPTVSRELQSCFPVPVCDATSPMRRGNSVQAARARKRVGPYLLWRRGRTVSVTGKEAQR